MSNTTARPVTAEARGRLRVLLADLEADAAAMERAALKIPTALLDGTRWKGKTGTSRALARICAAMPRAPDHHTNRVVLWRFLKPVDAIPGAIDGEDGQPRPGVLMLGTLAQRKVNRRAVEPFGVGFTMHSLGRLLDRSAFRADPRQAMLSAHDSLMTLPADAFNAAFKLDEVVLPAAGGAFIARPRLIGANDAPLIVCRTWIHVDQAYENQVADLQAWDRLLEQAGA